MSKPPTKTQAIKPGRYTIRQVLDSTKTHFRNQDWARSQARGKPFPGDKGLVYDTRLTMQKAAKAPDGRIRFQTTTYEPESFGVDKKGRFPRKWDQYVELPFDYDKNNVRGERKWRAYCTCPRYKFTHHWVLWNAGHAPKPHGKGLQAPDWARRGTRGIGFCKHLTLAMLAINKLSRQNKLPELLPDKAWVEIEKYWQRIESGNNAQASLANLANAPDSVRKAAAQIAKDANRKSTKATPNIRKSDFNTRGLRIPKPNR